MVYTDEFIKQNRFDQNSLFIRDNLILECICGSHCYGTNNESSDFDIVGIFMDRDQDIHPEKYGLIHGFDNMNRFESKEIKGKEKRIVLPNDKECEGEWKSLTNFFFLAGLKGSPNLIEILFVKRNFVTHSHDIGWMLRDNRHLFLSMRTFMAFKGYAFGQLNRIRKEVISGKAENPLRQSNLDKFGYDVKQANHLLRLLDQLEQVLTTQDIDLQRNRKECLSMRAGTWGTFTDLENHFNNKIKALEDLSLKVSLPQQPQTGALHELLVKCLEEWYGSESNMLKQGTEYVSAKEVKEELLSMKNTMEEMKTLLSKNCSTYLPMINGGMKP